MFKVAQYWTEKKTGTKWFENFHKEFETESERAEWLQGTKKNATLPRSAWFMPTEIAKATRKEFKL